MVRAVAVACLLLVAIQGMATPGTSVLHVKVSITAADQRIVPVQRHALLVSDNPATSVPTRIVTGPDGTVDIRLRAGNYTVESDQPAIVDGRAYQWTQMLDIVAGRDTTLELTAANAEVGPVTAEMTKNATPGERLPASSLFAKWQSSVVGLWTEHRHAAGFIVGSTGLLATSLSGIGDASSVEVQLSPTDKVAGRVLATDAGHDVAVVQINPAAAASAPVPLTCGPEAATALTGPKDLFTFDVPFVGTKSWTVGTMPDPVWPISSAGAPVFADEGPAVGLASIPGADETTDRGEARVVPASAICALISAAEQKLGAAAPPSAVRLPVESSRALPIAEIQAAVGARGVSLSSYSSSSAEFDILFITPVLLESAEAQRARMTGAGDMSSNLRAVIDFGEWSRYVSERPPVLFIRATPKLAESFWVKLARGAASTQGASIPPIKHLGPGFSRMRVLCGTTEIAPVHPLRIRARVSETDAVDEGFYAFDPMAIGPQCGSVSLVLSSVKDPNKTETRVIDPALIAQVWKDFAAYREK